MFFGARCKEIRLRELMHVHYVLTRKEGLDVSAWTPNKISLDSLSPSHLRSIKLLSRQVDSSLIDNSLRKVKKIYPYTSPSRTVLKILENCLPNMACPITQLVSCKDYSLKKLRHQESLNVRSY